LWRSAADGSHGESLATQELARNAIGESLDPPPSSSNICIACLAENAPHRSVLKRPLAVAQRGVAQIGLDAKLRSYPLDLLSAVALLADASMRRPARLRWIGVLTALIQRSGVVACFAYAKEPALRGSRSGGHTWKLHEAMAA
jgi:hypothetical protein